jgi:hypothetical protein
MHDHVSYLKLTRLLSREMECYGAGEDYIKQYT